jgi:hypothetical protein
VFAAHPPPVSVTRIHHPVQREDTEICELSWKIQQQEIQLQNFFKNYQSKGDDIT